ncbi:type I 3-dehydroquinate dehydratase [Desulfopila aestuarii]|uniref:3-dehydroquinate dehydratase n=1 Tax=Desulfopila aestuarii DSM 18488 TaxID=1121416 RepID=A0A1M7YAQ8_9BACT|nr:type I 3-dehydroquinate dehydratase [Desulfopila aestuarii]SHO49697.1 3-dehydroquinate dehydratase [Desulfopila aestuarii DSM 18488]
MAITEQGLICVAIGLERVEDALAAARQVAEMADVIEIRLDALTVPAVEPFTSGLSSRLLFTNRPVWEGGQYNGTEEERIALLVQAARQQAAFVDLELLAPQASFTQLKSALKGSRTRLIVSNHNFQTTPSRSELLETLSGMKERGADVGKIITTANNYQDVLRVMQLQEDAAAMDLPLIAFCMGRAGVISRVATLELGGFMTYCTVSSEEATAPGQIPVSTMRDVVRMLFPL